MLEHIEELQGFTFEDTYNVMRAIQQDRTSAENIRFREKRAAVYGISVASHVRAKIEAAHGLNATNNPNEVY